MAVRAAAPKHRISDLDALLDEIRACRVCVERPLGPPLPHEPRPVLRVSATAEVLISSQAPGTRVHASGLPFDDPSGDRLRAWMGVDRETFYDTRRIAIAAMGFCFPGQDANGADLPPRRECRMTWHDRLFALLPPPRLLLAVGHYAHAYHLRRLDLAQHLGATLSQTLANWREIASARERPRVFALPHPSWRNTALVRQRPWFENELLPRLREEVSRALGSQPLHN